MLFEFMMTDLFSDVDDFRPYERFDEKTKQTMQCKYINMANFNKLLDRDTAFIKLLKSVEIDTFNAVEDTFWSARVNDVQKHSILAD